MESFPLGVGRDSRFCSMDIVVYDVISAQLASSSFRFSSEFTFRSSSMIGNFERVQVLVAD